MFIKIGAKQKGAEEYKTSYCRSKCGTSISEYVGH